MSDVHARTSPWSRAVAAEPFPWFTALRAGGPVQQVADDLWMAVAHGAVAASVHDPLELSCAEGMGGFMTAGCGPIRLDARYDLHGPLVLITSDPPGHTSFAS